MTERQVVRDEKGGPAEDAARLAAAPVRHQAAPRRSCKKLSF